VRFTLGPFGDVEVPEGITLGECMADLVDLAGSARPVEPWLIDGSPLVDEQVAGVTPWVQGSRVGGESDPAAAAARAPWHLAVLTGPDAGRVAGPGADGVLRVGRAGGRAAGARPRGSPGSSTGALWLTDPAVSRDHLQVRRTRRGRWRASDAGSANGTRLAGRAPGHRPPIPSPAGTAGTRPINLAARVGRSGRRLRPGDRLLLGATTVELRTTGPARRRQAADRAPNPTPPVASWLAPVLVSGLLAAVTRNPIFLVFAAAGPAGIVVPSMVHRVRNRHRSRSPTVPDLGRDAAAAAVGLAAELCGIRADDDPLGCSPLARDGLALVGEPEAALAVARALLGGALLTGAGLTVLHPPVADPDWAWLRWLESRTGSGAAARVARTADGAARALTNQPTPVLVVSYRGAAWRSALDRWWAQRAPEDGALIIEEDLGSVPSWCRWVLTVGDDATLAGPTGTWRVSPPVGGLDWAESQARRLAARDHARGSEAVGTAGLPNRVALADLGLPGDPQAILDGWAEGPGGALSGLVAYLGRGPSGRTSVDLLNEGPHALVAGTTGAGKSELLQSLILGLALRHPPTELAMVLVDYKGGASFGACSRLPHVVGQVTDLGPVEAGRALDGLRWELRRREELLASAGVGDLERLRAAGPAPPRLLVVVDEFRALAEDLPDFVPSLVRLAAQGRSLGVHLVLATQRPAGAVDAQMRANLALRICLRVTEPADSIDVVETPDAAALPAGVPGRAVLRRGAGPVEVVQTAWAALPPRPRTRWAPAWSDFGRPVPTQPTDHCEHLVRAIGAATDAIGLPPPDRVWSDPLPPTVRAADLSGPDGLAIGLTDPPGAAAWGTLTWSGRGLLVVAGRSGSGRTTTLATVARAALAAGRQVHLVGVPRAALGEMRGLPAGLGTVVTAADPRRVARLIALLLADGAPRLLVVDDLGLVVSALDRLPRGAGTDLWERVLREGRHCGLALAVAGTPGEVTRLLPHATERLVLPVDPHDDVLLGTPREVGHRTRPGQAVHIDGPQSVRCQIAVPGAAVGPATSPGGPAPVRLEPIPLHVPMRTLHLPGAADAAVLPLGRGGDQAAPLAIDARGGALVVGPTASGRSTTLATLTAGLRANGRPVVVAFDGPLADVGRLDPAYHATSAAEASRLVRAAGEAAIAVVIDDLDHLARDPAFDDEVAGWVTAGGPVVIAAGRTDRVAAAYRGACAALRGDAALVVLTPLEPGSSDVAGLDLSLAVDPAHLRHPGRGVVVHRGRVSPVQVAQGIPPGPPR
jgi:S-DNA-T family DNA segregation ATPase FtsK/SpoIIIE